MHSHPPHNNHQSAANSVFMQTVEWLANVVALIIAWFATPFIHARSVDWVLAFNRQHYAPGFDEPVYYAWWIAVYFTTFCIARMSVSTLMVAGGLALAVRFL